MGITRQSFTLTFLSTFLYGIFSVSEAMYLDASDPDRSDTNIRFKRSFMVLFGGYEHNHFVSEVTNCTIQEPELPDFMTDEQRKHGGVLVHVTIGIYTCIAIAIMCHYYFVPSLEAICFHLGIQEDVGGATFLCIGASLPDIASAVMSIMLHHER